MEEGRRLMEEETGLTGRRVGGPRQLARADLLEFADGPGRGSRVARLTEANGFDIEVFPDRGMDLGMVSWRGLPLAWLSPVGPIAPGRLGGLPEAWERGFGGGLLTTCGLDQFGRPSAAADGAPLPMHGRAHTLVASGVHAWAGGPGREATMGCAGTTRQVAALGENLRLDRRVSVGLGSGRLLVEDRVTNDGPEPWPQLILYHVNLGWPLVGESASVSVRGVDEAGAEVPLAAPVPRDAAARAGLADWAGMPPPQDGAPEQVFRHPLEGSAAVAVEVANPEAGVAVSIRFETAALPFLYQWKHPAAGRYALGIEPANAMAIDGQAEARENGTLPILAPGESRDYALAISVESIGGS